MELPIKGQKPVKVGNSHYFTIPSQYVSNGAVQVDCLYDLKVGVGLIMLGLKAIKVGDSHYFPISIEFVRNNSIKVDKAYDIVIHEAIMKKEKGK